MHSNAAKHGKLSKVFAAIWLETAGACSSVLRHASFLSDPEQRSKRASKQTRACLRTTVVICNQNDCDVLSHRRPFSRMS